MHHSIIPSGGKHAVARCTTCCRLYHCPLCPKYKPSIPYRLQKHLKVHIKNAITFKDEKICRCSLSCRDVGHFHCPVCDKTIIRRKDMKVHLDVCHGDTQTSASAAARSVKIPIAAINMHHSIIPSGGKHAVVRCTTCCKLYHCPLCPKYKPSIRHRLKQHLKLHIKNAITFKDKKICRCSLNCRDGGHFHCPVCDKSIIRRKDMEVHLDACQGVTQQTSTSAAAQSEHNPDPSLPASTPVALDLSLQILQKLQTAQSIWRTVNIE